MTYRKHYIPLESDPEIFTCLMHKVGVNAPLKFVDVWSLERDEIQCLPSPVQALILIMPACPAYEEQRVKIQSLKSDENEEVVWFRQTINNACGLYAILHCACNIPNSFGRTEKHSKLTTPTDANYRS
jgi:ubiquitin carboxyl-terminal hydrolase L3